MAEPNQELPIGLPIGLLLRQRYCITHRLGAGSFGETYLAVDQDLPQQPQQVVQRFLPQAILDFPPDQRAPQVFQAKQLFDCEAYKLAELGRQSSRIPTLFAYFEQGGEFYLVLEFLEGRVLAEEMVGAPVWSETQVVSFLVEVLSVLAKVHRAGVVHRDIKPQNLLRLQDGRVALIDFGAVKEVSAVHFDDRRRMVASTAAIGTPGYISPEQAQGRPCCASDIYALGATAIEALTGVWPGDLPHNDRLEMQWRDLTHVSDRLAQILTTMTRSLPWERYPDAEVALGAIVAAYGLAKNARPAETQRLAPSVQSPLHLPWQSFEVAVVMLDAEGQEISVETVQRQHVVVMLPGEVPLAMVQIPAGKFLMGSPENEEGYLASQGPQHEVRVSEFLMGRYPVTQAQWKAVATLPQVKLELNPDPSRFKGDRRPVEQVNCFETLEFCARLSAYAKLGSPALEFRLPSEAEWEYACRAGTTTPFHFGPTLTDQVANYRASSSYGNGPKGEYRQQTTEVGYFKRSQKEVANNFGLCDMHGNVWEWCSDGWFDNYDGAPTDGSARKEQNIYSRVLRGGSGDGSPKLCRSAGRGMSNPHAVYRDVGFRLAVAATLDP